MVQSRRWRWVAVILAVPLVGSIITAGPAAAKKVVATGHVSCAFSQTISFNPPLAPTGTAGFPVDTITFSPAQLSGCTGTTNPVGAVPVLGTGTKPYVFKWKATRTLSGPKAGMCLTLSDLLFTHYKSHYNWAATGLSLKADKVIAAYNGVAVNPITSHHGFLFVGTAKGSFAGPVSIAAYFDAPSDAAWVGCIGGSGSVSTLTVDAAESSISVG